MEFDDNKKNFRELINEVQEEAEEQLKSEKNNFYNEILVLALGGGLLFLASHYYFGRFIAFFIALIGALGYVLSKLEHINKVNNILRNRDKKEVLIYIKDSKN